MQNEGLALHAHSFSISIDTYEKTPGLKNEMMITQTDSWFDKDTGKNVPFIAAMEHTYYPIFTTMYHPEYQLLVFTGKNKWTTVDN